MAAYSHVSNNECEMWDAFYYRWVGNEEKAWKRLAALAEKVAQEHLQCDDDDDDEGIYTYDRW